MKRVLMPIGILLGCILVAAYLIRTPVQVDEASPEVIPVTVRTIQASRETVQLTVESQGRVQPARTATVSAPVAGLVSWVSPAMEAGGYVTAGEPLLRLETVDFETARARSEAQLEQARAEAMAASRELERLEALANDRLVSQSQLQDARRQAEVTRARLSEAEAGFAQAGVDLSRAEITAPFNAVIESRDVELGQYVNRAQAVAVIHDADQVEVRVPLAIRQLGFLDIPLGARGELIGDKAPDVMLHGNYGGARLTWRGKLVRTEAVIDPDSNTVQTIIRVNQPAQADQSEAGSQAVPLPIGLFVEASIQGRQVNDIIALPRAVVRNNNRVLVVDAENTMSFREVEIFRLEEERVLISGGILPGEQICVSPIQAVVDGMAVQPVLETPVSGGSAD
jgi:RND family efflux transporter MFP subunit